jgi:hypothetical protein
VLKILKVSKVLKCDSIIIIKTVKALQSQSPWLIRQLYTLPEGVLGKQTKAHATTCIDHPLQNVLHQSSEDGSESESGQVSSVQISSARLGSGRRAAAASGGAGSAVLGGRVGLRRLALVDTFNDFIVFGLVIEAAAEVAGALQVELAPDVLELGHAHSVI